MNKIWKPRIINKEQLNYREINYNDNKIGYWKWLVNGINKYIINKKVAKIIVLTSGYIIFFACIVKIIIMLLGNTILSGVLFIIFYILSSLYLFYLYIQLD